MRAGLPDAEFLLATGAFGTADPRDAASLAKASHSGAGAYGRALKALAAEEGCAYLDMTTPSPEISHTRPRHAGELGE